MADIQTPQQQKPRLRVRRAVPADVPEIVRIHFAAFGEGVANKLIHPPGSEEAAKLTFGRSLFPPPPAPPVEEPASSGDAQAGTNGTANGDAHVEANGADTKKVIPPESIIMLAVTDPEDPNVPSEVLGFSKWMAFRSERPESAWNVDRPIKEEELGVGSSIAFYDAFIGGLHKMRRKWMKGSPCLVLGILATDPNYQRSGAGSAMLRWGAQFADDEGLPCWLEASPNGFPLYRRLGWEEVDVHDIEITKGWGAIRAEHEDDWGTNSAIALAGPLPEGMYRSVGMLRKPHTAA